MRFVVKDEGCVLCEIKDGQGVRGFRPSGRRSNDHWSPLDKPKIRKIRKIRDLINPLNIRILSLTRRKHSDGQQNTSSVFACIPMAVGWNCAASLLRIASACGERINFVPCIRTARSVFPHRRIASSRQQK